MSDSDGSHEKNGTILLFLFGIVVIVALTWGLSSPAFRSDVADLAQARGIVMFIFAILTGAIILATLVAIFFLDTQYLNRIAHARDLLTVVIGIFGTMVGYYFGTGADGASRAAESEGASVTFEQSIGTNGTILISVVPDAQVKSMSVLGAQGSKIPFAPDPNDTTRFFLKVGKQAPCPSGLTLAFTDKDGKSAGQGSITLSRSDLENAGWPQCSL